MEPLSPPQCRLFSHDAANNSAICFAYCPWYCLRVDVHRRSDISVPHQGLLNFQIYLVLPQQARIGVPKRMPSNTSDSGCDSRRNQMIFTNLVRPIRIALSADSQKSIPNQPSSSSLGAAEELCPGRGPEEEALRNLLSWYLPHCRLPKIARLRYSSSPNRHRSISVPRFHSLAAPKTKRPSPLFETAR